MTGAAAGAASPAADPRQRDDMTADRILEPAPTQIFLHIQKTAGTSLRDSLVHVFGARRVARVYEHELSMPSREFIALPEATRAAFRLIIGHFYYGLHPFAARPARYCTFVRDPLERIRSQYHQHLQAGTIFDLGNGPVDLVTVINEGLTDEYDNLQLRMIGGLSTNDAPLGKIGEPEFREAVKVMVTMFGFVGVTERLAEDWPRLLAYLGAAPRPLARIGITPDAVRAADDPGLRRIDWERVKARHAYEIALYDYILSRPAVGLAPLEALFPQYYLRSSRR
jgi:hypothetical protein